MVRSCALPRWIARRAAVLAATASVTVVMVTAAVPAPVVSAAAATPGAPAAVAPSSAVWGLPLAGVDPVVLRPYAPPARRWLPGHRGVDLAADPGQVVLAPSGGTVTFAGTVAGVPTVVVTSSSGWRSTLEPVVATVAGGTNVQRGRAVGVLADAPGHCGRSTCLHWGVVGGRGHATRYRDPLELLHPRAPVLVPWVSSR